MSSKNIHSKKYDIIVIGAGHAGIEAALASARLGCQTLILTINLDTIGLMSCNPAIGGPAKSQLVKEIDALGGQIGISADLTFLQMKTLNTTKGDAVHSLRAQSDRDLYHLVMKNILEEEKNLDLKQDIVDEILARNGKIEGVKTALGIIYESKTVIITTGTFLNGVIHTGMNHQEAGRSGELPAKNFLKA